MVRDKVKICKTIKKQFKVGQTRNQKGGQSQEARARGRGRVPRPPLASRAGLLSPSPWPDASPGKGAVASGGLSTTAEVLKPPVSEEP